MKKSAARYRPSYIFCTKGLEPSSLPTFHLHYYTPIIYAFRISSILRQKNENSTFPNLTWSIFLRCNISFILRLQLWKIHNNIRHCRVQPITLTDIITNTYIICITDSRISGYWILIGGPWPFVCQGFDTLLIWSYVNVWLILKENSVPW